jgi:hypothetical protein
MPKMAIEAPTPLPLLINIVKISPPTLNNKTCLRTCKVKSDCLPKTEEKLDVGANYQLRKHVHRKVDKVRMQKSGSDQPPNLAAFYLLIVLI